MSTDRPGVTEGFEEWRFASLLAALKLLVATGCGESSTEIDGVWVDVVVGCRNPECLQCGPVPGRMRPDGGLPPEDAPDGTGHSEAVWFPRRSIR